MRQDRSNRYWIIATKHYSQRDVRRTNLIEPSQWRPIGVGDLESAAMEVVRSRKNMSVVAGPGSGKTELLAQRACYLLQTGIVPSPRRILAISFKRDAAKNLQDRVSQRCEPQDAARLDSFTFDAFAKSLLDRFYPALSRSLATYGRLRDIISDNPYVSRFSRRTQRSASGGRDPQSSSRDSAENL